jgi:tetratricopeptide (TPR) repeat protein
VVHQDLGQFTDALHYHQQALPIRREVGDRHGEGLTLTNLGLTYQAVGRLVEVLTCQQQALAAFIQTDAAEDTEQVRGRIADL